MKKVSSRLIIIGLLVVASFGSYTYLVHVSNHEEQLQLVSPIKENAQQNEEKIFLPDVELVKKIVKTARQLVH